MSSVQEFRFPSARRGHTVYARIWLPEGEPRGVVQVVHGISEHVGRYEEAAQFLTAHGFLVCGEDHLGHGPHGGGRGLWDVRPRGGLGAGGGGRAPPAGAHGGAVPPPPLLSSGPLDGLLSHPHLSDLVSGTLAGCVLSGTGQESAPLIALGKLLASLECRRLGPEGVSPLVDAPVPGGLQPPLPAQPHQRRLGCPATRRRWTPIWPTLSAGTSPPSPCSGT